MTKISANTILTIQPIIEAIDAELAKEQPDRLLLRIESEQVRNLKQILTTYKSHHRREDWNGKFWMTKKDGHLEISFDPPRRLSFSIVTEDTKSPTSATFKITGSAPLPADGPLQEMNDSQVLEYVMLESPSNASFLIDALNPDTIAYLRGESGERTALINMLDRRGYKATTIQNHRLRISR